ncbi:MAG: lipoprotein NlpD [Kiritimatiellia bacterium]|jgi:lipoprotein NlpD
MYTQETIILSTSFAVLIKRFSRVFSIVITLVFLSSCIFSANKAPSTDLSRVSTKQPFRVGLHKVKAGETLFSIAWQYGVDYKRLAKSNKIGSDFLIYAGQSLILPANYQASSSAKASAVSSISRRSYPQLTPSANKSVKRSANVSRPAAKKTSAPPKIQSRPEKKSSVKKAVAVSKWSRKKVKWRWPTKGVVITNFSTGKAANKGIDLRGKKGDSVDAAAAGKVVYAGSGLRGYGKLIIIKHNDTYLSAYAHNDRIRVKEGQNVKAGQHIADIGSSGSRTESVKLHFEIRRNGQPINPLTLLPKRKT